MALRKAQGTRRVEIPHEPGEWMDFRGLGWYDLKEAQEARRGDAFKVQREMGPDLLLSMQKVRAELGAAASQADDPVQNYDLETLLRLGIAGWSYPEPVTDETRRLLDPTTAEWAARQIVGVPETEDERKNGSGGSTTPLMVAESRPTNG